MILGFLATAAGQTAEEYQVKAEFLFNLAKFVDWHPRVFKSATDPIKRIDLLAPYNLGQTQELRTDVELLWLRSPRFNGITLVITMKAIHVSIRRIGNSQGVVIPKPVLAQLGLNGEMGAEMTIESGALVLRRPASPAPTGWAEAARRIAESGDDALVMGEFGNAADAGLAW